jgi:hypothetical protein
MPARSSGKIRWLGEGSSGNTNARRGRRSVGRRVCPPGQGRRICPAAIQGGRGRIVRPCFRSIGPWEEVGPRTPVLSTMTPDQRLKRHVGCGYRDGGGEPPGILGRPWAWEEIRRWSPVSGSPGPQGRRSVRLEPDRVEPFGSDSSPAGDRRDIGPGNPEIVELARRKAGQLTVGLMVLAVGPQAIDDSAEHIRFPSGPVEGLYAVPRGASPR